MILHRVCHQALGARINRSYLGTITVAKKQIKIVVINSEREGVESKDLWCPTCDTVVKDKAQMYSYCSFCKQEHPLDELFIPQTTGGIYCEEHANAFFPTETKRTLESVINKLA